MQNEPYSRLACGLILLSSVALACDVDPDAAMTDTGVWAPPAMGTTGGSTAGAAAGGASAGTGGAATPAGIVGAGAGDAGVIGAGGSAGTGGGSTPAGGGAFDAGGAGTGGAPQSPTGGGNPGAGAGGEPVKSAGCGSTMGPQSDTYTINVGGMDRMYILRLPDNYDANRAYRLILSYHPLGGSAQGTARGNYYGLLSMSNGSTIFVAPEGLPSLGGSLGWADSGRTRTAGGRDIAFTKALVEELTSKLCIDTSRIFAEGFSMGGSMSYAVACALPDIVRGVVAHSGGPMSGCVSHSKPVAYFMTHGTRDNICTYPGYGVPEVNDFGNVNGCGAQEMPTPMGTAPSCVDFPSCMPGYPTRACIFVGGHTPSPTGNWVPGETWKFISQF